MAADCFQDIETLDHWEARIAKDIERICEEALRANTKIWVEEALSPFSKLSKEFHFYEKERDAFLKLDVLERWWIEIWTQECVKHPVHPLRITA